MRSFLGIAATAAALVSFVSADVDPLVIKGSKFFYKTNGTQFFIKGVAYQADVTSNSSSSGVSSDYSDPLADGAACRRDVPYLKKLQTNTIRVYAIDPTQDHTECMQLLQDNDIYVVSDLSAPVDGQSINRNSPAWNDQLYARYTSVVDSLANYTNVLGFFAGNEVSNAPNNTDASAFVKAAVRDTKAYIAAQSYRTIPVGYATNDDASIRENMADYFNCGSDQSSSIDFWGYNIYSWCGDSSYTESGYSDRTEEFSSYSVPAFFAEYGCNTIQPRTFSEVGALFGSQMTPVWSGGIVYMYFQEANDYGLVSVSGNSVSALPDFTSLSSRLAAVTPSGVNMASYSPTNSPASCPATASSWAAVASPLPPSPNQEACSCMYNSLGCVIGQDVSADDYGDIFGYVCGLKNGQYCNGIVANATTGHYGAYGMCNSTEQLSYVLNAYVKAQGSNSASACAFSGSATTKAAASPTGSCSALLNQAGTAGTGVITSSPTATGGGSASGGSGGSSGGSSSSSKGAAAGNNVHHVQVGLLSLGAYALIAVMSGMAMVFL